MGMSDLRIVSDVPAGSHLVEISIEELAKRLGLDEVDVPLLMRSLEDAVANCEFTLGKSNENHDEHGRFAAGSGGHDEPVKVGTTAIGSRLAFVNQAIKDHPTGHDMAAHMRTVSDSKLQAALGHMAGHADAATNYVREHITREIAQRAKKNLTVGDVHATTSLKDVTVAYIQGDDDGSKEKDDEAEEAKQKRGSVSGGRTGGGDAASKARLAETEHGEVRLDLAVTKVDPDQRKIFGWASVCAFDGKLVVDKQDDIIHVADLERAAHDFTLYSRTQGDMHSDIGVGRLIESVIFDQAKRDAGIIARDDQGRVIDGWWVGFYVDDDSVWQAHKRGERPEFSIGGRAQREPV